MNRSVLPALAGLLLVTGCGTSGSTAVREAPAPSANGLPRQVQAVIATDHGPSEIVVGRDSLFLGTHRGGTIQRIDPGSNRVTATVQVGGQLVLESSTSWGGLAQVDERSTWLWACTNTDGSLHQVDPRSMRVTASVAAQCNGGWRTRVGDTLWAVPGGDSKTLLILDVRTAKVLHRVPLGDPGNGWGAAIATGGQVLIGAGEKTPVFSPTGRLLSRTAASTPWITAAGGRLFRIPSDGSLTELNPRTLAAVRTFHVAPHSEGDPLLVADTSGHVYYRPDSTHVYTVDLATGAVSLLLTLPYSETPTAMAWAFGSLWITNFDGDSVWRVDPTA